MENKHCLNCGNDLTGKFCSNCGQKSDTHKITLKHLLFHDILHGTFHFEKGMLFTAKQALLRPGKAALDYISGKRVNYYNTFYFILILIGATVLISHYFKDFLSNMTMESDVNGEMNLAGQKLDDIFSKFGKILIFLTVPLTALNSYIVFKREKLIFSEHIIISGILLLGIFIIIPSFMILGISALIISLPNLLKYLVFSFPCIIIFYIIYVYYNAFRKDYTFIGFSYRIILFLLLLLFELLLFFILLLGIATSWEGGTIIYEA